MIIESMLERFSCISQGKIQSLRFSDALKLSPKQTIHKRMHL